MGNPSSSEGLTDGIFDVFRGDVIDPDQHGESENQYVGCSPEGRSRAVSQRVAAVQNVRQIGENPLLISTGF